MKCLQTRPCGCRKRKSGTIIEVDPALFSAMTAYERRVRSERIKAGLRRAKETKNRT